MTSLVTLLMMRMEWSVEVVNTPLLHLPTLRREMELFWVTSSVACHLCGL